MPNAMTLGSDKPFIVITTGLVDLLDAEETGSSSGTSSGHVLSGHAVYRTMLYHLTRLATRLAWFAIGYIGLRVIIAGPGGVVPQVRAVLRPGRRAGQPGPGRGAPGADEGGRRVADLRAEPGRVPAAGQASTTRCPTCGRACSSCCRCRAPRTRSRWSGSPSWTAGWPTATYQDILAGNYPRREDDSQTSVGDEFLAAAKSYQESWNRSEDPFIGLVKSAARDRGGRRAKRCSTASSAGAAAAAARAAATTKPGATWIAAPDRPGARSRARTPAPAARPGRGLTGPSSPGSRLRRS